MRDKSKMRNKKTLRKLQKIKYDKFIDVCTSEYFRVSESKLKIRN